VLKHIIAPATKECGYTTVRADKISEPGIITSQVIQHLVDDPLVVADLTGHNPNVFYELAVRHAIKRPIVQIIQAGESIPFDVAGTRTIQLDHRDLDSVARCREELIRQIRTVEKDVSQVDTPISVAVDLQSLRGSDNPLEKSNAEIISMLQDLRVTLGEIAYGSPRVGRVDPELFDGLSYVLDRLDESLTLKPGERATKQRLEQAHRLLRRARRMVEIVLMESGFPPSAMERMMARRHRRREPSQEDE